MGVQVPLTWLLRFFGQCFRNLTQHVSRESEAMQSSVSPEFMSECCYGISVVGHLAQGCDREPKLSWDSRFKVATFSQQNEFWVFFL